MKRIPILSCGHSVVRLWIAGLCLLPALANAHPGHYHPGDEDEFDFFRATIFHSHGASDFILPAVVLVSVAVFCLSRKSVIRFSALAMAMGSLSLLSVS